MENLTIRLAVKEDIPRFHLFFKKSINELFPQFSPLTREYFIDQVYPTRTLRKWIQAKSDQIFIAFQNDTIVGFLLVMKPNGGLGFADWLAVDKKFQKHGIASKLLKNWEKNVLEQGGHAVHLNTNKKNLEFYKNQGFTLIGHFPNAWFGLDYYHFYKNLAPAVEKNYLREYIMKKKAKSKS